MPFYKYRTDLGNTVTAKSTISFTGLAGNEAQISSTIDTPANQSVNLYKVVGGLLVTNDDTTLNNYYKQVGITIEGDPTINQFTGYTATTAPALFQSKASIAIYTGTTEPATYLKISNFNTYSGTSAQARLTYKDNGILINTGSTELTTLNFSSGITITNKGGGVGEIKVIYGSEVFSTGKTTTSTTTSATFVDYISKTFTLAGGTYKIEYVFKGGIATTNTNFGVQLLVDGVVMESGSNNVYRNIQTGQRTMISTFGIQTLSAGAHNFKIQFTTSAGTLTADYGQILITRIG